MQVKDGAIPALNTLARSTNSVTAQLAMGGLVNLATTLTAAQADSMQRVVIRTTTSLLAERACNADCLHFCALATKNLTVLDNVRAYLDDEVAAIATGILTRLGLGHDDTIVLCMEVLSNCLPLKQSRVRVTESNIVPECQRLLRVCGTSAQHSCTVLLAELSKYSDVAHRLLDGGVMNIFSSNLSSSNPKSGQKAF